MSHGASGIIWSSSLFRATSGGGAENSALCLFVLSASPSSLLIVEVQIPGVLEALSTITASFPLSSGGGEKVQI